MMLRKTFGGLLAAVGLAACMQSGPMNQPANGTTQIGSSVETVTWTDGKPAFSIRCDAPVVGMFSLFRTW
jgi:hypothetical protein